jgi:hypothetical protein
MNKNFNMKENTQNTIPVNTTKVATNIGKKVTFPDNSTFPIQSIFDVCEGYTQVCYLNCEIPQIVWVPNEFITND